jgi:hypothetical protein
LFCGCTSFNQTLGGHWERIGKKNKTLRGSASDATIVIGVYQQTKVDTKQQKWYMNAKTSDITNTFRFPKEIYPHLYNPRLQ